jgi:disulfide bond formation protein DsbB
MHAQFAAIRRADAGTMAALIAIAGASTILGAYFFQYVVGVMPCPLCLEQRMAYYVTIPLAAMVWLGASYGASRKVMILGFAAIAVIMLWNTGLAAFHAGVEWKFWPGPTECSGPLGDLRAGGSLMSQLNRISVVRCDEASWRFLGLSLAGWNVFLSLGLAAAAAWGALGAARSAAR